METSIGGPEEPLHARLLGYLKGTTLIVRLPHHTGENIPLNEGDEVVVRGFSGRIAFVFSCTVEKIRFIPFLYCHLRFPMAIRGAEIRKSERVEVNIPAHLVNPRLGDKVKLEAIISDISVAGAMLTTPLQLGEIGDTLTISFRFKVPPNDYEVKLHAAGIIQTITPPPEGLAPSIQYGIKFQSMRSTEGVMLQTLIYQRLLEK